jgi:excisionase family DNA binding protein
MSQDTQTQAKTNLSESLVLTVGEAARLLRLSKTTTYEQIRQGSIPSIRMGKRILVPRAALMRMLEETMEKAV